MANRRKTTPADAPATLDEAIKDIVRYVEIDTGLEKLAADAKEAIARVKATHDATAKPMAVEAARLVLRLRNWWAVAGPTITEGLRKSTELAGVKIGLRMTNPACKSKEKTEALAAASLSAAGLHQFVRIEISPNKPAILDALSALYDADATPEARAVAEQLKTLGFKRHQREEFFIARPETLPTVETVAEPQQEAA